MSIFRTARRSLSSKQARRVDRIALPSATSGRWARPNWMRRLTYSEFLGRVRQAANLFRRLGCGENDAVAILAPHALSTQIALWGAELAGRACPINPMLAPQHIVALTKAAGATVAVVLGENDDLPLWPRLMPALRDAGCVTHVLDCDSDRTTNGSDGCFERLLDQEAADALNFRIRFRTRCNRGLLSYRGDYGRSKNRRSNQTKPGFRRSLGGAHVYSPGR